MPSLPLPNPAYKTTFLFKHPDGVTGWTENVYIAITNPSGPIPSVLDPIILSLVNARKALLCADATITAVRVQLKNPSAKRMAYLSIQNVSGTIAHAGDVFTLPCEVVGLYRMQAVVGASPGNVYRTMHYLGGVPSTAFLAGTSVLDPAGIIAGATFQAWVTALINNCLMVYKFGGALVGNPYTSGAMKEIRSRDRGRPLGVWHGIHGH